MSVRPSNPDWITYVPRRVYDAARRLEAACERSGYPSPIGVAEYRWESRRTRAARILWHQVWRLLMEEHNASGDYAIKFVVVDDPTFECLHSVTPKQLN
ncbi:MULTISPECIES: hypothetical protein [unclassified Sulfitobacter]|uniref:hypothetical protein n=1 Tax=unclassified Sulfitobacter TaxID=196795 RepID=UPI000AACB2FA|nr:MULTISPECIES: hypothetical protein [unclassified Sulfitobacter]